MASSTRQDGESDFICSFYHNTQILPHDLLNLWLYPVSISSPKVKGKRNSWNHDSSEGMKSRRETWWQKKFGIQEIWCVIVLPIRYHRLCTKVTNYHRNPIPKTKQKYFFDVPLAQKTNFLSSIYGRFTASDVSREREAAKIGRDALGERNSKLGKRSCRKTLLLASETKLTA